MKSAMEMDARRIMLAREILSTDNETLLSELEKTYRQVMAHIVIVNPPAEPEPDTKEYILNSIKEGLREVQEIKAGRMKGIPARELLQDLQEEAI